MNSVYLSSQCKDPCSFKLRFAVIGAVEWFPLSRSGGGLGRGPHYKNRLTSSVANQFCRGSSLRLVPQLFAGGPLPATRKRVPGPRLPLGRRNHSTAPPSIQLPFWHPLAIASEKVQNIFELFRMGKVRSTIRCFISFLEAHFPAHLMVRFSIKSNHTQSLKSEAEPNLSD
jgi:hypothetical protein